MTDSKPDLRSLKVKRGHVKRVITLTLKSLQQEEVHPNVASDCVSSIQQKLKEVEEYDMSIATELADEDGEGEGYEEELAEQVKYQLEMKTAMEKIKKKTDVAEQGASATETTARLKEIKLPTFSGTQADVMEFNDFFTLFEELIGKNSKIGGESKLLYLKTYLRGSALDQIKHLSNDSNNYELAVQFLKKEFLNKDKNISTFQTDTQKQALKYKPCKLCQGTHSMLKCNSFQDAAKRRARLAELKLCTACSGQHSLSSCPGKDKGLNYPCTICGDKSHITALCVPGNSTQSRLCLMSEQHGRRSLLPTTSVVICACGEAEVAKALIDHGSQASYISQALAEKLKLEEKGHEETFTVKTCIGTEEKRHRVVTCEIAITPKRMIKAEFLIDPNMDLSYNLPGVSRAVKQLQDEGVILADCFYRDQETDDIDNIHCLLGVNVLSDLTPLRTVSLGQSVAYEVDKGHIIFGDLAGLVPDHLSHLSGPTSEPTPEDEEELLQTINETNINIKQQDQHRTTPEEQTEASTFMMMADIEKAFLQVHLKYESDQDHFCFLWKTEEGVKAYRFKTILFGLNASPFILNHILQLHLQRFRETEAISALKQSLGTKTKSRFTINRLKTAQQKKKDQETLLNCEVTFRYVNTLDNVADMVTRGISYREFERSMLTWLSGPSWLADTDAWPQNTLNCLSEATKRAMQVNTNLTEQHDPDTSQQLLDPGKYSSLKRLYGVTARVYHFINKLKGRQVDCYKQAEDYWIRRMQQKSFPAELRFLREKENQASKPPPKLVNDLNLFLDEVDILRCKGRLSRLNYYSYSTLNPVLLAKEHQLTSLLINDQHLKCKHLGIGTTLTALRERGFWIPAGRQVVKRILKDCITCKKHNSLAFSYPKLTDLPKERVRFLKSFHDTAIDYTGHIFVKDDNGEMKKVYIVLYTDLAIRSVHLDVVPDLTVKSFIQSFSRFCSIYRVPHTLYTDNASYFIAAQRLMENFFLSDDFREHLARLNIIHKTIPAYASWVGGVYERQVKTIKQCLHKTVGRVKLTYYELITHLAAIQDIVNGRPITYVNSQLEEIEPLTPNKILKVHSNPRLRLICEDDRDDPLWTSTPDDVHQQMNNTLQEQQRLQDKYTKMWYSDYLLSLRETSRDVFQSEWIDKISVGDIVLIDTRDRPRVYWQMGRQDERQVDRGNWFRI
ncbi:hypothetical protein FJT64_003757 [Amphibalanus amphitrite]|uniref:Integrase catalytic domain-containing protein n=1 Tax=Amphibalanus amphitrite TaxID=1232801 RepID=A0A6A4W571_AMPAM|nr:hypothetical protein FJT64_003757 [Amphibalanus amphitrite]